MLAGIISVVGLNIEDKYMVNMLEPRMAEKYGYETNSASLKCGLFLLKMVGVLAVYVTALGVWWLVS